MEDNINNALAILVLSKLLDTENIDDVTFYEFNIGLKIGKMLRVKGVVKVEIDDIEEVD